MDILELLKMIFSSESVMPIMILVALGIYNVIIKPERNELKDYREKTAKRLEDILSKDDFEKLIKTNISLTNIEQSNYIIEKLKEYYNNLHENARLERLETIKDLKAEIIKLNDLVIKFNNYLADQENSLNNVNNELNQLANLLDSLYKIIKALIDELEEKGLIQKIELPKIKNEISENEISTITKVIETILSKQQSKNKITKILSRGQNEEI